MTNSLQAHNKSEEQFKIMKISLQTQVKTPTTLKLRE
jgi:hypothetical protein